MMQRSRTAEIMADAAWAILTRPISYSGNFCVDDDVLIEEGTPLFIAVFLIVFSGFHFPLLFLELFSLLLSPSLSVSLHLDNIDPSLFSGVTNFDKYAVDPNFKDNLQIDFFVEYPSHLKGFTGNPKAKL